MEYSLTFEDRDMQVGNKIYDAGGELIGRISFLSSIALRAALGWSRP